MLNRRHLRIKVLQCLYAFFQKNDNDYKTSEKELFNAVERIHDLYLYLLLTFEELQRIAHHRIEENRKKIRPTPEDLNPNLKFVQNRVIELLSGHSVLRSTAEKRKISWVGDDRQEMFRKLFKQLRDSETYFEFMNNRQHGFAEDKAFAIALFKSEIANASLLYDFFEEKSIHWIDDLDLACSMVIKTIKDFDELSENQAIFPLYKNPDDEQEFLRRLLSKTVVMDAENEIIIDQLTKNWELDRIAKMDVILMKMAITELQVFNNIPAKVTLNEYIEISKFYSTPRSHGFINGILDNAILRLEKEGKLNKIGRGLQK